MSGSLEAPAYTFRRYEPADEDAVLEMLRVSLGDAPVEGFPVDFFRWKHHANPFGRSFMLLAETGGEIAGLRAFLRWRFLVGDRPVLGVRAVDTATHPDHQGRGVFSRLTRAALDALRDEVDLVFNTPNSKSLPGYLKLGWQMVGSVPIAVRVRRPIRFAARYRKDGGESPPAPAVDAALARDGLGDEAPIGSLLEAVASEAGGRTGLRTDRSAAYLRWRYADVPGIDYHVVRHEDAGSLRGLAIFRVRPRRGLVEATVTEVLVPPGDRHAAATLLRAVARAARVDHVTGHFWDGSTGARAARRSMFVRPPGGLTLVVNPLRPVTPDPTDLASWRLSVGDLELF
ncbi:MAG TPA: GNAT family N-acetyltransferase [Actinomycetota bacterium]